MALTIGSAGSRAEQKRNLLIHACGVVSGALVMGLLLMITGAILQPVLADLRPLAIGVAVVVLSGWALAMVAPVGLPFPSSRWQVPHEWRHTLPFAVTAGSYGFLLGMGVLTNVVLPVFWAFLGLSMFGTGSVAVVGGAWVLYGSVRSAVTAKEALTVGCSMDPGREMARPDNFYAVRVMAACACLALVAVLIV